MQPHTRNLGERDVVRTTVTSKRDQLRERDDHHDTTLVKVYTVSQPITRPIFPGMNGGLIFPANETFRGCFLRISIHVLKEFYFKR